MFPCQNGEVWCFDHDVCIFKERLLTPLSLYPYCFFFFYHQFTEKCTSEPCQSPWVQNTPPITASGTVWGQFEWWQTQLSENSNSSLLPMKENEIMTLFKWVDRDTLPSQESLLTSQESSSITMGPNWALLCRITSGHFLHLVYSWDLWVILQRESCEAGKATLFEALKF